MLNDGLGDVTSEYGLIMRKHTLLGSLCGSILD